MPKFDSRKEPLFITIVIVFSLLSICLPIYRINYCDILLIEYFLFSFTGAIAVILIWTLFNTHYTILNKQLHCRCGPFQKEVCILKIEKIVIGRTTYNGVKFATARKGIIIYHSRFDTIYISPKKIDLFIDVLVKINPSIKINS